jgi:hypothetical protein
MRETKPQRVSHPPGHVDENEIPEEHKSEKDHYSELPGTAVIYPAEADTPKAYNPLTDGTWNGYTEKKRESIEKFIVTGRKRIEEIYSGVPKENLTPYDPPYPRPGSDES